MATQSFESNFDRPHREPDTLFERMPFVGPVARAVLNFNDHGYVERAERLDHARKERETQVILDLTERVHNVDHPEEIQSAKLRHPAEPFL